MSDVGGTGLGAAPFRPLYVPSGIMGCVCSSNPEDDWMENIDVCENCHYPIVPLDSKTSVRGRWDWLKEWGWGDGIGEGKA